LSELLLDTEPPQVDPTPSPDQSEIASSNISPDYLNHIRTELLEDFYHDDFAESDYWQQSHEWSWGLHPPSDDYQHFLGRYE
jgi:hypothetical protein